MFFSLGFMLIIIKLIRIIDYMVIFIDYIYMNMFEKLIKFGFCFVDIFDYLLLFCIMVNILFINSEYRFFWDFRCFNENVFY